MSALILSTIAFIGNWSIAGNGTASRMIVIGTIQIVNARYFEQ